LFYVVLTDVGNAGAGALGDHGTGEPLQLFAAFVRMLNDPIWLQNAPAGTSTATVRATFRKWELPPAPAAIELRCEGPIVLQFVQDRPGCGLPSCA
jgi:hypothetical protein